MIIQHTIWLYFRFPLSFRGVAEMLAEMLAERGIEHHGLSFAERGENEFVESVEISPTADQKTVIVAASKLEELFGLAGNLEEPQPVAERDDFVVATVHDQHRTRNQLEKSAGRKSDPRQPPRWKPRVYLGCNVRDRDEAALYDQCARPVSARHGRRDRGS